MSSYATAILNELRYNEFGNGIQFNSLTNWGTQVSEALISDSTVKLYKSSGSNIVIQYFYDTSLISSHFTL